MSAFAPAETLREHRPLLLAMEAIGWFHMAGKARSEFLRHHGGDRVDYEYEKWHDHETPPFPWDDLLGWVRSRFQSKVPSNAWPGSFKEFTEKHREQDPGLLGLLQASHGIVSGVEKNLPGQPLSTSASLSPTCGSPPRGGIRSGTCWSIRRKSLRPTDGSRWSRKSGES
jgi:hypothetical protein